MKTCYIYSFIDPLDEEINDNRDTPPLGVVPVHLADGRILEAAILGVSNTVKGFRLSIPNLIEEAIDPEDYRRFFNLRKLMLDCIRMAYDPSAEWFRVNDGIFTTWNFIEIDNGPSLSLKVSQPLNPDYRVNIEGISRLFAVPRSLRPILHLLADGGDFRLPVQFRFLSLYKIVELHYKVTPNRQFIDLVTPFFSDFQSLYPDIVANKDLCRKLARLRNRCAHIKLTTGDPGFSHFEAENDELIKAMPIIRRVAIRCIDENYPDAPLKFAAAPEESDKIFAEMERRGEKPVRVI